MRTTPIREIHTRSRWSQWLSFHNPPIAKSTLARALKPGALKDDLPRAMVRDWMLGERTVSASSAWSTGEALRGLAYDDGGPMSLYAAGYYEQLIRGLGRLAVDESGQRFAAALACALPPAVDISIEITLANKLGAVQALRQLRKYANFAEEARNRCTEAIRAAEPIMDRIAAKDGTFKSSRNNPRSPDPVIGFAIAASMVREDPAMVRGVAWQHVIGWAQRLHGAYPGWAKNFVLFGKYDDDWRLTAVLAKKRDDEKYIRYERALLKHIGSRSNR